MATSTSIIEERKDFIVSPNDNSTPNLKIAHFLKPSFTSSIHELQPPPPPLLPPTSIDKPSLNISSKGFIHPQENWKIWVTHMHSLHQELWKEVGIHDAIMNSTYKIDLNHDLVVHFAEKWCPETNTFVFTWGECTLTLEDMMFLGGYSVLGDSVFSPLEDKEEIKVFKQLEKARKALSKTKSRKAQHGRWLSRFMDSETQIEHEAFLALWLSRYVFPKANDAVSNNVFPIAVRLARGIKIALAPAVLASIYSDLRLMKMKLTESRDCMTSSVVVRSPIHLVQIWVFERFTISMLKPNDIEHGEPRFARWCEKNVKMDYTRVVTELGFDNYRWCPYGLWPCKFYNEKDGWVLLECGLDEELESFARCLRVSELVGIDCSCIEQYLPHRVAMQFGLGQDIPSNVAPLNESAEIVWVDYMTPIGDVGLYFPSRFFEPCVTTRYFNWWNHLRFEDNVKKGSMPVSIGKKSDKFTLVPPGFPPKGPIMEINSCLGEVQLVNTKEVTNGASERMKLSTSHPIQKPSSTTVGYDAFGKGNMVQCNLVSEECKEVEEDSYIPKTTSDGKVFSPRCSFIEISSSSDEDQQVISHDVINIESGSENSSTSPPMKRPSPRMADNEGLQKGNTVQNKLVTEELNKHPVHSSVSSKANNGSFEMEELVKIKESNKLSGNMYESEKEAIDQESVHLDREKGESSSQDELEILGSWIEGRINKFEKLMASLKAAKLR